MKKILAIISQVILLTIVSYSYCQTHEITGKVIDYSDGSPVIGCTILLKGTMTGTVSDIDGGFKLSIQSENDPILVFSYIRLKTYEGAVQKNKSYLVTLVPMDKKYKNTPSFMAVMPETTIQSNNEVDSPPILSTSNVVFKDPNQNNRIDANENCSLSFIIDNSGKGPAKNVKVVLQNMSMVSGLSFDNSISIGNIEPGVSKEINVFINGTMNLTTGNVVIKINFEESNGFPPDPIALTVETKAFVQPKIQMVDYAFLTDNGIIRLGYPVQLKVLIQNIGQGIAEEVKVDFEYPSNVFANGPDFFSPGSMQPGETKELIFDFIPNKLYSDIKLPITAKITEKHGLFGETKQVIANIDAKSSGTTISIASNSKESSVNIQVASLTSEVDKNIPFNPVKYQNRYALIIGNEDYSSRQMDLGSEINVMFAANDARIFKEYCVNTLGIEEKNLFLLINGTAGEMHQRIELITQILTRLGNKGELIFFYAGHGFPDEITKEPYLIPVDVTASNLGSALKLADVYRKFSQSGAQKVTIFLDACFTGGGRESGLLSARSVKVKPKVDLISGNLVIFAATSEDQSAMPFKEKTHGMFTYFLLKKLQETKGDVTYSDLERYLSDNVSIESLKINSKPQDPKVIVSPEVIEIWENWKINDPHF